MDRLQTARAGWLELLVEVLESSTPWMPWERICHELGHQLGAPVAGRFRWDEEGTVEAHGYPCPDEGDLREVISRAPRLHPLARHYSTTRSWRPLSTTQVPFAADGPTHEYWSQCRAAGMDEHLWVPVSLGDRDWLVVGVCRDGTPFEEGALELARLGQQVVTALHRHYLTLSGEAGSPRQEARVVAAAELGLTPRQVAVLTLVAEGLTAVAIGHRLHVSSRTVEQHLHHIYERLRVHDRASAVRRACLAGLIQDGVPEPQISAALSRSKVKASSSRGLVR